jgi:large subunit ribosomal protein L4
MKPEAKVIKATGATSSTLDLPAELFGGEVNEAVMHQAVTAQLAAARRGTASTKTRSEVRGGGAKPWRQKGTGRARHGSTRSPIWVGGGIVHGPKPRNFSVRVNKKVRKAALRSALADKASAESVYVLDEFSEPRTKAAAACLGEAGISGRVLVVLDPNDEASRAIDRAFRNLRGTAFTFSTSLAAYDVLVADAVLFTRAALDAFAALSGEAGPGSTNEEVVS